MIVKIGKINIGIVCILCFFSSCIDETFTNTGDVEGTYISVRGIGLQKSTDYGSSEDYIIRNFRILAFDKATGECKSNKKYSAWEGDIIRHQIDVGNYDFVFLANEPANIPVINKLNAVSVYTDLNQIAYPASYFSSDQLIPMIQEIKDVTVLSDGQGAKLSNGTETSILQLALDRLAVRIEVVLESQDDFGDAFKGITFSKIPDRVPLTANYEGEEVERNVVRTFTVADDGSYFSNGTPTIEGGKWAKKVTRIILPASELETKDDKSKAIVFTVNMESSYSPSCELKIVSYPVDYSLPINTKLDFMGIIKDPLEMNIKASEWDKTGNGWDISDVRTLNVSNTEVSITDYNGARVSFWTNMKVARVLDKVKKISTGEELNTNDVFNALASQEWLPSFDERFIHEASGSGYMEILTDRHDQIGEETYELTLMAADDYNGKNALMRKILVHVKQEGEHFDFIINSDYHAWSHPYVGAFYKDNETGERVISGGRYSYWHQWTATVSSGSENFIIISATPSLDPDIGTDSPGDPEDYPVIANSYKRETGLYVQGKGRIYFRIGLRSKNPNPGTPRYGTIDLTYQNYENDQTVTYYTKLYVRQGEDADYIMRNGSSGNTFGQKFTSRNLTLKAFKDNPNTTENWYDIDTGNLEEEVDFVDYPTQAGTHFQWGLPTEYVSQAHRGYHPTNKNAGTGWSITGWPQRYFDAQPLWNPASGVKYKDYLEICPPGYYRPTDGPTDQIAVNSNDYTQVHKSEWRMSLFSQPMKGDGSTSTSLYPSNASLKTEWYQARSLPEVMYGFYADGFFDRRPIKSRTMLNGNSRGSGATTAYKGVSLDNANAAYGGTLIYNPTSNASVFFPAAGRRWHVDGSLEYASETGYYWSASVAPGWTLKNSSGVETGTPYGNIWSMEFNYPTTQPKSTNYHFGYSMRCVKR